MLFALALLQRVIFSKSACLYSSTDATFAQEVTGKGCLTSPGNCDM